ncbi:MAG: hypothetical protein ACOY3E_17930 [Pseudomonadota bacterium]
MMTRFLLLLILSLSVGSVSFAESANTKLPLLLQFTDDPARAMHLPLLREVGSDFAQRELRIWIGFGVVKPESLARFVIDQNGNLSTESYLYYGVDWKDDPEKEFRDLYEDMISDCTVIGVYGKDEACRLKKLDKNLYRKVFKKIEALGVWTLPDGNDVSTYEDELVVSDGIAMVIEVRDGPFYRAYSWSNPGFRKAPEAIRASKILAEVSKL